MAAGFAALACSAPVLAAASYKTSWTSVVSYVVDGDTVRVRPPEGGKPVSIRVDGIDAPEICQPGGTMARDALKRQVLGKRVVVQTKVRDVYGRLVGRILLNRQDQGALLVAQGLAWSYRYRDDPGPYAAEQSRAQAQRLGMFSRVGKAAPVYPAVFRKKHGSCYARYR
ncbi:MAG: thermonuclease family protein [Polaromonas sp.]|nr:thermonuclease family protein [Polaromonas sp.]